MQLPTYTSIWRIKRVIYRFYDVPLPRPVAADQMLLYAACFIAWIVLWWGVVGGTPFSLIHGRESTILGFCWYIIPPWLGSLALSHPNDSEGKNPGQRLVSWVCYLTGPKVFEGGISGRHIRWWLRYRSVDAAVRAFLRRRPVRGGHRVPGAGVSRKVLGFTARALRAVRVFIARTVQTTRFYSIWFWMGAVRMVLAARDHVTRWPRPRVRVSLTRPQRDHPPRPGEHLGGRIEDLLATGHFPKDEGTE